MSKFMKNRELFLSKIAVRNTAPGTALSLRIARLQDNNYLHQESAERLKAKADKEAANARIRKIKYEEQARVVQANRDLLNPVK